MSLYLQGLRGLSPLVTGAAFLPPSAPVWTLAGLMVLTGLAGALLANRAMFLPGLRVSQLLAGSVTLAAAPRPCY